MILTAYSFFLVFTIAMCKSSSLAFVLLFAFAFKLERPTWTLAGVIGVICVGLFMMVMSEVDFVLIGYVLLPSHPSLCPRIR